MTNAVTGHRLELNADFKKVVRVVAIEPILLAEPDFEVNRGFHRLKFRV